jgi:hypothetical protein
LTSLIPHSSNNKPIQSSLWFMKMEV